jgi:outer membrane lipoprotein-sorting protein
MKLQMNDFPDPFLNYKDKGYSVELLGTESIDGADAFKLKLTKLPVTVDGVQEDNISYYYFDAENFIPLVVHTEIKTGPMKGQVSESKMSDYLEVDGLFLPHSITQGLKGQPGQAIAIDKIELNPQVDDKEFEFPEEEATEADPEKK